MNSADLRKAYNYLISSAIADKQKIDKAFEKSKKDSLDIFDVLIDEKIVKAEKLTEIKASFLGVPYIKLTDEIISNEILKSIPEKAAMFYKFIPFEKNNRTIKIAMVDPTNIEALDALKFISIRRKVNTEIHLISKKGFNTVIKQYKKIDDELKNVLENVDQEIVGKEKDSKIEKEDSNIKRIAEEAPVSKVVNIILTHAIEGKASDIHVEPNENELVVRYRLDGVLHNSLVLPKKIAPAVTSRIKILANLKIDETRKPQDGRFRFSIPKENGVEKCVDLRVSTFPTVDGEKVVMRILDTSSNISTLESLGIWKRGLSIINENIDKPFGIILVTGPTGSGKSTTLYAMLKILNKEGVNIVTLEDPVEYFMTGINQSQIRSEIGYTFSSGLRSILRQDPDIIMVGEIRDKETAELATHAALTGHLVLSTLHTNNAIGVIPRLIDMGVEPFLISSSLNIAIAQRLVKKICDHCKKEIEVSLSMEKIIRKELENVPDNQKNDLNLENSLKLFHGKGCKECKQSGFSGRIGIYEVLLMTPELESVMSSNISDIEITREAKRQGMITMKQDGIMKALTGTTTIEEVLRVTEE
jgi:type IV pilus assembly protein PilB